MRTIQPSNYSNRIYLNEYLTSGLKIKNRKTKNIYTITSIDEKESDVKNKLYCIVLDREVDSLRDLFYDTEYTIVGYKPEYSIELKSTKQVDLEVVDDYFDNLKSQNILEREYREFMKSKSFDLSGYWAVDRENFK